MAQLPTTFNAHSVEPSTPTPQLSISGPEGHPVIISASEFKPSKSNQNNGFLELTLQVIDGPHKGEIGAYRLNLFHENAQTVEIASRQLSAICHVTNQMMIADSQQLHNIPFRAIVGPQKKQKPDDPDYTQVVGVLDIQGNKPKAGAAGAPSATPAPAPAPAPAAPAWGAPAAPAAQAPAPQPAAAPWGAQQAAPAAPAAQPATAPPWARQ